MSKELEEAVNWLATLDIKSEYEATNKELILNYIDTSIPTEVIKEKLMKYFDIGTSSCMAYNLTRVKEARQYGTLTIDDFVEFDENTINDIVNYILKKIKILEEK